jgi:hypothetical protein
VERAPFVVRENEPGPSGFFPLERVVAEDDVTSLEDR